MSGKLNWPEEGVFESSRSIDCRLSAATVLEVAVLNTLFVPWSLNGLVALPKPYSVSVIQTLSDHSHLQQYCNLTIKYYRKNISQGIAVKSPFRLALFIPSKASLWWQYGVPTFLAWKCSLSPVCWWFSANFDFNSSAIFANFALISVQILLILRNLQGFLLC